MILDDDDLGPDDDRDPDVNSGEDDTGWLDGLRSAGLPIREPRRAVVGVGERASPGLRQLLDEASPAASVGLRQLVAESLAPATRTAYERDWADFDLWCRVHDLPESLDATPLAVGEYVNELVRDRKAISTIRRRLAAIRFAFTLAGRPSPTADPLITSALAGAQRLLGTTKVQAAPLRLEELRSIVVGLPIVAPNRPTMRRDQTLIALGWAGALRSAELVGLDVDDLHVVGDPDDGDGGLLIRIRNGKGAAGHVDYVAVPFSQQWSTCPVRRTLAYLRPLRAGPLFRHIDRHGTAHRRLTPRSVTDVVRQAVVEALQVDPGPYTSHSLRAGFVTEARSRGVPDDLIARHTRHTRPGHRRGGILNVYDRPTDLLERSALESGWW
jgi:integrase